MANYPTVNAQTYAALVAANSAFRAKVWSTRVLRGVQQRTLFNGLVGDENSKMPIIRKRDISKGQAQQVEFTTIAPVRGMGVLGENDLTGTERKPGFGSFTVTVDLIRHAVSYSRVIDLMRKFGKPMSILSSDLMSEWWARRMDDDYSITLRQRALLVSPANNLLRVNQRASQATLLSSDTLTVNTLDMLKGALAGIGGKPIEESAEGGMKSKVQKFLFLAPDNFLAPMRNTSSWQSMTQNAGVRGDSNSMFSGLYDTINGTVINNHIVQEDDADGRQGSPLQPYARLGTATADDSATTITGGGTTYPAGDGDYFAYFPGYPWKIYDAEVLPTDNGTKYAMIYNVTTDGKYEIFSYTSAGLAAAGSSITSVTRGTVSNFNGNVIAQAAGRFSAVHPSGSIILPCTINGVILGYGLEMGVGALYHATGEMDMEPISNKQDYENDRGDAQKTGIGIQGIRGMACFVDKRSVAPNFILLEGTYVVPGVNPEPYLG